MKVEKILLVAPDPGKYAGHRHLIRIAKTLFPPLGLLCVAAQTPPNIQIKLVDEAIGQLDFNEEADLVGLTANTASVMRAYEIAAEFRRRGKPVVIGGIHATAVPEEALKHADMVVKGEAEGLWGKLLTDLESGQAQEIYTHKEYPDITSIPRPKRELISPKSYYVPNTIQTSRGCPFRCRFCSVYKFFGGHYRMREISEVISEVNFLKFWAPKSPIIFVDDNIFGNRNRARDLMEAIRPLQVEWFGQASMNALQDDSFLALAEQSGCRVLFVGLESLSPANLKDVNKAWNNPAEMKETVARLDRHNIAMLAAFIIGLPEDRIEDVEKITRDEKRERG